MATNAIALAVLFLLPQSVTRSSPQQELKPALNPYPPVKGEKVERKIELTPKAQEFIRNLTLIAIPDQFEDDKKWGSTKARSVRAERAV